MADIRVRLFGDPTVELAGTPVRFASRSATSLLAYLLIGGPRRVSRSLITGTFWPDMPETRARKRLSHTLWQITSTLGDEVRIIDPQREFIEVVDAGIWVDVWAFDDCIDQLTGNAAAHDFRRQRDVEDLVRGELGEGIGDDWIVPIRERYRHRHGILLTELVRSLKARNSLDSALEVARRLVDLNPFAEEPHREVMRLLRLLGRPAEAVDHFDQLQNMLQDELGARPEAETQMLLQRIIDHHDDVTERPGGGDSTTTATGDNPIVGRDPERAVLRRALDETLTGAGGVVLVDGVAGIGKTRLLDDFGGAARWRGFDVATITCRALGGPYSALLPALRQALPRLRVLQLAEMIDRVWLQELATFVPQIADWLPDIGEPEPIAPGDRQQRRIEAIAQTLAAAATARPLIIVIEDLHEAQAETLAVIERLARSTAGAPLLLGVSYRPIERHGNPAVWSTLLNIETAVRHRLSLGPVPRDALTSMAFHTGADIDADHLDAIYRETGGNPLFVLETMRSVAENADQPEIALSPSVQEVIAKRVALVAPSARAALEAIAVLERPAELTEILELSGHASIGSLSSDIEDLARRALVVETGDDFAVSHAQLGRVVYDHLDPGNRVALHAAVASRLTHMADAELAWHAEAGQLPEAAARFHAAAAAAAITAAVYQQAVEHYASAIRNGWLDQISPDERFEFHLDFETALDVVGDADQREQTIAVLERIAVSDDQRTIVQQRRIRFLASRGRLVEAMGASDQLIEWAREHDRDDVVATAIIDKAHIAVDSGSSTTALELLDGLDLDRLGPDDRLAAIVGRARGLLMVQGYDECLATWRLAQEAAVEAGDPLAEVNALGMSGVPAAESGRSVEAWEAFTQAIERAEQIGHRFAVGHNLVNRAALMQHNDPGSALHDHIRAHDIFVEIGNPRGTAFVAANLADLRQSLFGVDVIAEELCAFAHTEFEQMGNGVQTGHCLLVAAKLARAKGNLSEAADHLRTALMEATASESHYLRVQVLGALAQLLLDQGDTAQALEHARMAVEAGTEFQALQYLGDLYATESECRRISGDTDGAIESARRGTDFVNEHCKAPYRPWWQLHLAHAEVGHSPADREALVTAWDWVGHVVRNLEIDDRKQALDTNEEFRAIAAAREKIEPTVVAVELPSADAPTGRALTGDDHLTVLWTVDHPDDPVDPVAARATRVHRLTEEAAAQGAAPTVDHLAQVLGVSHSSIRRALSWLRKDGHEVITRGSRY